MNLLLCIYPETPLSRVACCGRKYFPLQAIWFSSFNTLLSAVFHLFECFFCLASEQVGYVTTICFSCFLVRCIMVSLYSFFSRFSFLPLTIWELCLVLDIEVLKWSAKCLHEKGNAKQSLWQPLVTLPESKAMLPIIYKCITGNWFEYIYLNIVFFLRYKLLAIKSTFLQICFKCINLHRDDQFTN